MARGNSNGDSADNARRASFDASHEALGVPKDVPSILDIKKALPAHCFQPDLTTSFYYIFKDLIIVSLLYLSMLSMELLPAPIFWLKYVYMPIYWYMQGTMMAAIFVLGHDCGHGSFSTSDLINDIVGNFMHTIILVPYYPWKLSHRHHHQNTGNIDKDEVFYPVRERDLNGKPQGYLLPYFGLGVSWFMYMLKGYAPRCMCHLNPMDPMLARKAAACTVSLACLAAWATFVVVPYGATYGLAHLFVHYLAPVFGFGCWIVFITFLHHHDENVPWYADEKWDFVRGQLSSVDRHYGFAHGFIHNIGTHQIHHLFTRVPHYHLEEATTAFRETFPHLVRKSDERLVPAFIRMFNMYAEQLYIKDDTQVHSYQTKAKKSN